MGAQMAAVPGPDPQAASPRRCVLVGDAAGDSRLAVAVACRLIARGAAVVIVGGRDRAEAERVRAAVVRNVAADEPRMTAERSRSLLHVVPLVGEGHLGSTLESDAVSLGEAHCLLALSENAEQNLRAALIAHRVARRVPVVLRAFDPELAHELERPDRALRVQRAYSLAHLSAPAYVAAVLFRNAKDHVMTMRVGVEYVSVCRVRVPAADEADPFPAPRRRRTGGLLGRTPEQIAREDGCQVLARLDDEATWHPAEAAFARTALQAGDEILVGGPLTDLLDLARSCSAGRGRMGRRRLLPRPAVVPTASEVRRASTGWPRLLGLAWSRLVSLGRSNSVHILLPLGALVTIGAFVVSPAHRPGDLLYQWASTALGNADSRPSGSVTGQIFGAAGLLAGGIALGLATSIMSAALIQRRIIEGMRRRAGRLRRHVVIVGSDDVGLRVADLLRDLGISSAVVATGHEREPAALAARSGIRELAEHTPILTGELRETLKQARIDRAAALIACSEDNLVNVEACMRAKRRDDPRAIRTIARIFDDCDATRAPRLLGVDESVAAVEQAAPAFVDAALEGDRARTIDIEAGGSGLELRGLLWHGDRHVDADELRAWHSRGIRVLALLRDGNLQRLAAPLEPGDLAVLAGPRDALDQATQPPWSQNGRAPHVTRSPADGPRR